MSDLASADLAIAQGFAPLFEAYENRLKPALEHRAAGDEVVGSVNLGFPSEVALACAKAHKINGAVILPDDHRFTEHALEDAGIPVMVIPVDPVDGRTWDEERINDLMGRFLEDRVAKTL